MDGMMVADWAAIQAERIREGRCRKCGAYDGPTHLCPHLTPTKTNPNPGGRA